jgi:hypothetical protein
MPQANRKKEEREKRVAVKLTAVLSPKDRPRESIEVEVHNLSTGGAYIQCLTPLPLGSEIQLKIQFAESPQLRAKVTELPKEEKIEQNSLVKWSSSSSRPGFGIEFLDPNPENQTWLSKVMDYFEKLCRAGVNL